MRLASRPHRRLATAYSLVLATAAVAFTSADVSSELPAGGPVEGSVQQAYTAMRESTFVAGVDDTAAPGARTPDNVELPLPDEPLTLQAVRVGREAAEPTLGVTSDGTAFFAAGTFDGPGIVVPRTEVMRSDDGGLTWTSVSPVLPDRLKSEPPVTLDPMVYVDEVTDRVFNLELYVGCAYLLYSDDDFETLERNPAACGEFVNDHQSFVAGPVPVGAAAPVSLYEGRWLYYCFNRVIDADCGRSIDGGRTFVPTAGPAFLGYDPAAGGLCGGLHGHIATDPDGRLLLPKGHCGTPWLGISEDGGDTWTRVQVSQMPAAGPHLSVAADAAGNIYMLWWDRTHRLPWLSVSRDHGATWDEPRMIAPPGVEEVNFPVIVAGDEGRIAINFPGNTSGDHDDEQRPWNQYVVVGVDAHTEDAVFHSATANDPDLDVLHRGDCLGRCGGLWDFTDVVFHPGTGEVWAAAADDCVDLCDEESGRAKLVGDGIAIRQLAGPGLLLPSDDVSSPDS